MNYSLHLLVGLTIISGAVLISSPAFSKSEFDTDISLGMGAASNPFLENGDSSSTGTITGVIHSRFSLSDAVTTYRIAGTAQLVEHLRTNRPNNSFSVRSDVRHRLSETVEIDANVGYQSSISGANNLFFNAPVLDDNLPDPVIDDVIDDIALNGNRQRRHTISVGVGASFLLSPRDSLQMGASGRAIRFGNTGLAREYDYYSQNVSYSRQLSETTSLGLSLNVGEANYLGTSLGDAVIISPAVTGSHRISSLVTVSGSIGASFANVDTAFGKVKSTDWSASLDACRESSRDNICLGAERSTLPSSINGVRSQSAVYLIYSRQLSLDDRISLSGRYSHASNPITGGGVQGSLDYVSMSLTGDHDFDDRFTGFVRVGYADTYQSGIKREADVQVNIGVRMRFGKTR